MKKYKNLKNSFPDNYGKSMKEKPDKVWDKWKKILELFESSALGSTKLAISVSSIISSKFQLFEIISVPVV